MAQYHVSFDESFIPKAFEACKNGASESGLAALFKVSAGTIRLWKTEHPAFLEAICKGLEEYQNLLVEKAFFKRATGYRYREVHEEIPKNPEIPTNKEGLAVTKRITKEIPPDPKAAFDWLTNRQPDRWKKIRGQSLAEPPAQSEPVEFTDFPREPQSLDHWEELVREIRDRQGEPPACTGPKDS